MEREGEKDLDKDGWTHSWGIRAEPPSEIERDGEELPRMSPGVGCDKTAQGKVIVQSETDKNYLSLLYCWCSVFYCRF